MRAQFVDEGGVEQRSDAVSVEVGEARPGLGSEVLAEAIRKHVLKGDRVGDFQPRPNGSGHRYKSRPAAANRRFSMQPERGCPGSIEAIPPRAVCFYAVSNTTFPDD